MLIKATTTMTITLLIFLTTTSRAHNHNHNHNHLNSACSVTRYPSLCIHTLTSYSHAAEKNPGAWARGGVSVALAESERVSAYLSALKKRGWGRGRRMKGTVDDCVETFSDCVDELHSALFELRGLQHGTFKVQMSNVETWVSAALTDQTTCLDEFAGYRGDKVMKVIHARVLNTTYLTSNALALVNSLAGSGGMI